MKKIIPAKDKHMNTRAFLMLLVRVTENNKKARLVGTAPRANNLLHNNASSWLVADRCS